MMSIPTNGWLRMIYYIVQKSHNKIEYTNNYSPKSNYMNRYTMTNILKTVFCICKYTCSFFSIQKVLVVAQKYRTVLVSNMLKKIILKKRTFNSLVISCCRITHGNSCSVHSTYLWWFKSVVLYIEVHWPCCKLVW